MDVRAERFTGRESLSVAPDLLRRQRRYQAQDAISEIAPLNGSSPQDPQGRSFWRAMTDDDEHYVYAIAL
jgi:hypothetical protein